MGAVPIVHGSSTTNVDQLLAAIEHAAAEGVPLQLMPGTHLTKPGRVNTIPIGRRGLRIMPAPQFEGAQRRPTIKRRDGTIDLAKPDDNHGLFFIPAPPSDEEKAQATWRRYQYGSEDFDFAVIIRGRVRIEGITVDCNMARQGLPTDPGIKNPAEHSCMLGFAGRKYPAGTVAGRKRFVFVGFEAVELVDIVTRNGGYADDVWFSRGYFQPNIERVQIDRLVSKARVAPHRSTVCFSGLCQNVDIHDCDFDSLGLEDTARVAYRDLPRVAPEFHPSVWTLRSITMRNLDLGANGNSYVIHGSQLVTKGQCVIHRASGEIVDSEFRVGRVRRRLLCLDDFTFRNVTWTLEPDTVTTGKLAGLVITARPGVPCEVSFIDNVFTVDRPAPDGPILDSEYTAVTAAHPVPVEVRVRAVGCHYPGYFGTVPERPIAKVRQRGTWTFARADLGDRDPDIALPKAPHSDVVRVLEE